MEFVKEYVFYNINIKDIDEFIVKTSSDCSDRYIHSYSLRQIFNVKIIDMEANKTKNKVFKYMLSFKIGITIFGFRNSIL